ncbi:MAG: DNA mismatch repair protein [Bacteroidales bacterium]|nr:DNA mismatch repair protein [Bacteroidales bacterium]
MSFIIDKQTLDDLGIFSRNKEISVYALYNNARTRGGARILEDMFYNPLDNYTLIRKRADLISRFQNTGVQFPFRTAWFDAAEFYLSDTDERTRITTNGDSGKGRDSVSLQRKIRKVIKTDTEFEQAERGMISLIWIINTLYEFSDESMADIRSVISGPVFAKVLECKGIEHLSDEQAAYFDNLLRYEHIDDVKAMLDCIYHLDVYISVAATAKERGFVQAEVLPAEENVMEFRGIYHPALRNPVANDLTVSAENNIVFLTGANMAGKSTFMKTFGIAVFLAHVGFPVPAASMRFSVRDGLFTTINLPDNLNRGYSHFYAEVRRLKRVAQSVNRWPRLVVIFDELFRGTNVKDAFDATVAVTEAFSHIKGAIFMISTHIIEAGEELKGKCGNIGYIYLPTVMKGSMPEYTYRLEKGITEDRHGMLIIRNEGILNILKKR